VLASEEVMTHTPFVAWPGWGCYGGGYDRASALGGTLAVIAPVRRKRKSREGESIGRPRCATQRRVRGGGSGWGSRPQGSRHGRGGPGERRASGLAGKGNGRVWATVDGWLLGQLL
jgi:hypothetical protein